MLSGENSEGIEGVSEMLKGLQEWFKLNPQGVVALPVNSQRSLPMPLNTEKLVNREQSSEIQPSPSGKSYQLEQSTFTQADHHAGCGQ